MTGGDELRTPYIVDVRRNSLDDGPGIRSVVFFKGCPLRCTWCQNPETLSPGPQLQRLADRCSGCGRCVPACPHGVARPATEEPSSDDCVACGACVQPCASLARRIAGTVWDAHELLALLVRDEPFYRLSGGGVTLSGGEPTLFPDFAGGLAAGLAAKGVHVLVETCGRFQWESFERHLLAHLSTVYFDLKLADDAEHRLHTGRGNQRIHDNLRRLAEHTELDLLPRVPLVPGITDSPANLSALASLLLDIGLQRVALLPYNPLWVPKRQGLGMGLPYDEREWMTAEHVARCEDVFAQAGLEVAER